MIWWFILAAAAGAVLRYLADFYLPRCGILTVNILGSGLAGSVLVLAMHQALETQLVVILLGGLTGSLTTYSTVALATARQHQAGEHKEVWKTWTLHVGLSTLTCLAAIVLTHHLVAGQ